MNSDCKQIDDYLEDTLSQSARAEFENHLLTCEACRQEIEIEHQLDSSLQEAWKHVVAPEHVHLAATQFERPPKTWNHQANSAFIAIASTILMVTAILVWNADDPTPKVSNSNSVSSDPENVNPNKLVESAPTTEPPVTVITRQNSPSIIAQQNQKNPGFTIFHAYTAVTTDSKTKNLREN